MPKIIKHYMTPEQKQENRDKIKRRYNIPIPERDIDYFTAKKLSSKAIWKITPIYTSYFLLTLIILIYNFGKIKYGPNLPYLLVLALVGLPYLGFFGHILTIVDKYRERIIIDDRTADDKSIIFTEGLVICGVEIILIRLIFDIANKVIPAWRGSLL